MKSASKVFDLKDVDSTTPGATKQQSMARSHYMLAAILFVGAILLSTWVASTPNSVLVSSPQTWSEFALYWLCGGLITLFLLARAAKR